MSVDSIHSVRWRGLRWAPDATTIKPAAVTAYATAHERCSDTSLISRLRKYLATGPTTADILLDALLEPASSTIGVREHSDLRSYLGDLAAAVNGWARSALRAIATVAQSDPRFAQRFNDEFLAVRHSALTAAVRTSSAHTRSDLHAELIAASMWYRVLIVDSELDNEWVDDMAQLVASGTEHRSAR